MKKDFVVTRSITEIEGKPHVETISEAELARCKDCKNGIRLDDTNYFICTKPFTGYRQAHTGDWFCADGERFYTEECK